MFFRIKVTPVPALVTTVVLIAISIALQRLFNLSWDLEWNGSTWLAVLLGFLVVAGGMGLAQGGLSLLFGEVYRRRFLAFSQYIRQQGPLAIFMGGVMACGEELLFRGVVLHGISFNLGWGPVVGVVLSAASSGAAHFIPNRQLALGALWPVWEGLLLGGLYLFTGSLLVVAIVHALDDIVIGAVVYITTPASMPEEPPQLSRQVL